jgi:osmoprotectant transport system permease protein
VGFLTDPYNWRLSNPDSVPVLLGAHIYITVLSMAIGLLIAFPIALLVARYRRAYLPVLTTAGIIYTLPSLAVLALLVPFTGLSLATVLIPLVAYAQVVLIRNIVAAIRAVDPALVEVGRAMGMNAFQLQWRVVLPLALPVIIAGLRVATVTTIGIATLAPLVGTDDLGTMIFQGFNFSYNDEVVAGVFVVSLLAVVADLALLALQALLARGRQIVPAA